MRMTSEQTEQGKRPKVEHSKVEVSEERVWEIGWQSDKPAAQSMRAVD